MGERVASWLAGIFLIGFFVSAVLFNAAKPRVMILHSYDPDYSWTRDIDIGVRRVSEKWTDYSLSWHFMDTKRHGDRAWLEHAGKAARRAIDRTDPHVLIAVDDLAQELAAKYYVGHPGMNIVFAGVNGYIEPYGYVGAANVTGIYERKPLQAVKELIQSLESFRGAKEGRSPRLTYLVDPSPSMQLDRGFVDEFDWAPLVHTGSLQADSFEDWKRLVITAGENSDYLLVANYRKLPRSSVDAGYVPPDEVMAWTEANSPVPVIGVNTFNVEDGGAIAVGASPFEQGRVAARMTETILEQGLRAGALPPVLNRQYVVAINRQALERRHLHLPQVYETFARTTATYIEQ